MELPPTGFSNAINALDIKLDFRSWKQSKEWQIFVAGYKEAATVIATNAQSEHARIKRIGQPTNQKSPDFNSWKVEARRLTPEELVRHASVSIDNRHKCQECFCCACVEVLQEPVSKRRK